MLLDKWIFKKGIIYNEIPNNKNQKWYNVP